MDENRTQIVDTNVVVVEELDLVLESWNFHFRFQFLFHHRRFLELYQFY